MPARSLSGFFTSEGPSGSQAHQDHFPSLSANTVPELSISLAGGKWLNHVSLAFRTIPAFGGVGEWYVGVYLYGTPPGGTEMLIAALLEGYMPLDGIACAPQLYLLPDYTYTLGVVIAVGTEGALATGPVVSVTMSDSRTGDQHLVREAPGSGPGHTFWLEVFHDRAGNAAAVDEALAGARVLRKILGVAWYYHASSDVADRVLAMPQLVAIGGAKPTGFTLTGNNANFALLAGANVTLSADQEGAHFALGMEGKDGRMVSLDNGAPTVASSATAPCPFPITATEDELGILRFLAISAGEALDTHSAYIYMTEWAVPTP